MKIGFDAKRFFHNGSGLGNYSRDLIRILAEFSSGNQFVLFDSKGEGRGQELLENREVQFSKLRKGFLSRQFNMGLQAQDESCQIFHGLTGELPFRWSNKPIKKVVSIHDLIFEILPEYYSFFDRKIHFYKFKKAAEQADVVVAISEQSKKDIIRFLKIPEEKIKVIYQGCSHYFKEEYPETEKQKVKEKFSLPERFVLNVGTIETRKNALSIVEALSDTEIPLVLVGKETKYAEKVKQTAKEKSVVVRFLKDVSNRELAIIYQLADIFVYPSEYEGFGIPIIEALYSKTPVITNKTGVFPEAGGSNSAYIDIHNIAEMKHSILELWQEKEKRHEMIEKGLVFVQKFNDEILAKKWIELYETMLTKS